MSALRSSPKISSWRQSHRPTIQYGHRAARSNRDYRYRQRRKVYEPARRDSRDHVPALDADAGSNQRDDVRGAHYRRSQSIVGAIRQAVRDIEPNLPLNNIKTQIEQADETLSMEKLSAKLMSLFGLLAQQLASIGLYGALAYSVSRRTHRDGIRMALGANRSRMLTMILRQGMTLTVIGIALGLGSAYVLTKYLESLNSMLFGVQPRDPITFAASAVLLTIVALVACFVPARRATKVDPMVALRYE